jgi:hypothetical protein
MAPSVEELIDEGGPLLSVSLRPIQNGQYVAVSLLLLADGDSNWIQMPQERLAANPIRLQIERLVFPKQNLTTLAFGTLSIVPIESETGVTLQKNSGYWNVQTSSIISSDPENGTAGILVTQSAIYAPILSIQTLEEGEQAEGEGEPLSLEDIANSLREQFDETDTNDDGQLSYDEANTIIPNLDEEQFNELDVNGDGFLTLDELEAYLSDDDKRCGCCKHTSNTKIDIKRYIGDWLLVGLSLLVLISLANKQKR